MKRPLALTAGLILALAGFVSSPVRAAGEAEIEWRTFDAETVAKAREEKKLVFLDVEAVWCHWCHVMDAKTYPDPAVRKALKEGFVSAKLDQDSRPDLARRYEEYGWPALVILDPVTMKETAIGSGFQTAEEFLALLEEGRKPGGKTFHPATVANPSGALTAGQKQDLQGRLREKYNKTVSGWGSGSKFVPWGNIEYCIRAAQGGDAGARSMAQDTLTKARALIDPVWGGVYQYSTDDDWEHPHFEKIMEYEAEISRAYALAYQAWKRPEDLAAAESIVKHLGLFLRSPEGAYHVSQDADVVPGEHSAGYFGLDDAGRRAIGIPRVDKHVYSRENGLAIVALEALYEATGKESYLEDAKTAARWIIANRSLDGGGFSHDAKDEHGPCLADQIQMGRALLALHQATAEQEWLDRSIACARFCARNFTRTEENGGGYLAGVMSRDLPPPVVDRDENIVAARWMNLLAKVTRDESHAVAAKHAMKYLASQEVVDGIFSFTGGLLLADEEIASEPVHIAIVGRRDDAAARALFDSARKQPSSYKVLEWISPGSKDSAFPDTGKATAYVCTDNRCAVFSSPGALEEGFRGSGLR